MFKAEIQAENLLFGILIYQSGNLCRNIFCNRFHGLRKIKKPVQRTTVPT